MGGTGTGASFQENVRALADYKINMRTLHSVHAPDTTTRVLGQTLEMPIIAAPVAGLRYNMSTKVSEEEYIHAVVSGAMAAGTLAGTGDGEEERLFHDSLSALKTNNAAGLPFIKPWHHDLVKEKIALAEQAKIQIFGMDVDAAGLITLREMGKPVFPKSLPELRAIAELSGMRFVVKGIMTVDQARLAVEAGADAIVVSNHGGRVLDHSPATATVLPDIAAEVGGDIEVLVDGGVRNGTDVFKMLALGAKAVLVGRPVAIAAIGGGSQAVAEELHDYAQELKQVMIMTGRAELRGIDSSCLYF